MMPETFSSVEAEDIAQSVVKLQETIFKSTKEIKSNDSTFDTNSLPSCAGQLISIYQRYIGLKAAYQAHEAAYLVLDNQLKDKNMGKTIIDVPAYRNKISETISDLTDRFIEQLNKKDNKLEELNAMLGQNVAAPSPAKKPRRRSSRRNVEDDIAEVDEDRPFRIPKDPITKQAIEDAVKSRICGHVYDRKGVEMLFQQKEQNRRRVRCAHMGCNKELNREDIIDDPKLSENIARARMNL